MTPEYGQLRMEDGSLYQGQYITRVDSNGVSDYVAHGMGRYLHSNGDIFEGQYRDGQRTYGKMVFHTGCTYEGSFDENELPSGQGSYTLSDGRSYKGTFANNRIHGKGVFSKFVHGCDLLTYAGVSLQGEFFSDDSYQSTIAHPQYMQSYNESFTSRAKTFVTSLTCDLEALVSLGPDDTIPN